MLKQCGRIDIGGKFAEEKDLWISSLSAMLNEQHANPAKNILTGFFAEPLKTLKTAETAKDFSSAVVICSVKNDLHYLKEFLPYYRSMGVKHFAFIDNESSDGTVTYLMEQPDVSLYKSDYKYHSYRKFGWKLQIIAKLGLNHWYLVLDSDEFFSYMKQETHNLNDFMHHLEKSGYRSAHGFLLDMYPSYPLMDGKHKNTDFFGDYRYFDGMNRYYHQSKGQMLGGLRERVMNAGGLRIDKCPLVYCCKNHIPIGNHDVCGITGNSREHDYTCVLRHYKFLPEDTEKYRLIAKANSGYSCTSILKNYVNKSGKGFPAWEPDSILLDSSEKLSVFPFLKNIFS